MNFQSSVPLTFGLELELQIVDPASGRLSPSSVPLLAEVSKVCGDKSFALEATLSTIELNSSIHRSASDMEMEVMGLVGHLRRSAHGLGLDVRGGGTHVAQFWNERVMAPSERAVVLENRFGFLPKRFSTYGMHVHIGMPGADEAVRVANVLQAVSPLLIAMSASSPFLQLADTGFAAARPLEPLVYPNGGPMPYLQDWAQLKVVLEELYETGFAHSLKDIYWDVRPKPEFGTVEVRVFDTPLSVVKAVELAAFTRAVASLALQGRLILPSEPPHTAQRVSRFAACRSGMSAKLYNAMEGRWLPASEWLDALVQAVENGSQAPEDLAHVRSLVERMRQREDHALMREAWVNRGSMEPAQLDSADQLRHYSVDICRELLSRNDPSAA